MYALSGFCVNTVKTVFFRNLKISERKRGWPIMITSLGYTYELKHCRFIAIDRIIDIEFAVTWHAELPV